ncbi:MAG TPA: ABC transporter ATP-binding protein [Acidimicrobiales bacterium]|nr:ABC transporter ATP-binding protein [Acidimicrobiales bacterium]
MAAIEVDELVVTYGDLVAVDGVSFTVGSGEVVTLLGPNGAGKTSTVETLEGYRAPASGRVRVLDADPIAARAALAPRIGVMLQGGGVDPGIRAIEMLRLYAGFHAAPADPDELLARVGLSRRARSMWRQLSGGEQQRLSLALALVGHPRVAFLDEPSAGVDVAGRQLVRKVVRDLADDGVAVLLTTHDLAEAEHVADRVVIIDHGRVIAAGRPSELTAGEHNTEIRFGAPAGLDTATLGAALGAAVTEESPGEYRVATAPTPAAVAQLTAWLAEHDLPLADLRAGRHRLEDVFLALTNTADIDVVEPADGAGRGRRGRRARRRRGESTGAKR